MLYEILELSMVSLLDAQKLENNNMCSKMSCLAYKYLIKIVRGMWPTFNSTDLFDPIHLNIHWPFLTI